MPIVPRVALTTLADPGAIFFNPVGVVLVRWPWLFPRGFPALVLTLRPATMHDCIMPDRILIFWGGSALQESGPRGSLLSVLEPDSYQEASTLKELEAEVSRYAPALVPSSHQRQPRAFPHVNAFPSVREPPLSFYCSGETKTWFRAPRTPSPPAPMVSSGGLKTLPSQNACRFWRRAAAEMLPLRRTNRSLAELAESRLTRFAPGRRTPAPFSYRYWRCRDRDRLGRGHPQRNAGRCQPCRL